MWARQAAERVVEREQFTVAPTLLDVGCGRGEHAEFFRSAGFQVTTIDSNHAYKPDILSDFSFWAPNDQTFDIVWASHVLEHQRNVFGFLRKCHNLLTPKGIFAVTVPPAKHNIVGGHLTLWNQGLLVYNLIVSGFDCKNARVSNIYDTYNISCIVENSWRPPVELKDDAGDIETLAEYFPFPAQQGFDGSNVEANW